MIRVFKSGEVARADILYRGESGSTQAVEDAVADILADVKKNGDAAVLRYCEKFDGVKLAGLRVAQADIDAAYEAADPEFIRTLTMAAGNIEAFHKRQIRRNFVINDTPGVVLGQKVTPIERVGLYVPGGQGGNTPLISSLLMGAVPAQVAGVREIAVVSPPREDGSLNPYILAAAYLLDITEVYRVGGPWAIAALAQGTASIPAVDVIAGPGNIFVTTAKKLVQGKVGIDMLAGPSEILVLADDGAQAEWIAADLLSQAEHDKLASAICVTDCAHLADRVLAALSRRLADLPRAEIASASLRDWGAIILVPSLQTGIDMANAIAPEHMEVLTRDPWSIMPRVRHAGALFLGQHSAEAVGDYYAGPNHVLPTMGSARHASALGVQTFCKKTSIISATAAFTERHASSIARLARLEGLEAHARSVELRGPRV